MYFVRGGSFDNELVYAEDPVEAAFKAIVDKVDQNKVCIMPKILRISKYMTDRDTDMLLTAPWDENFQHLLDDTDLVLLDEGSIGKLLK